MLAKTESSILEAVANAVARKQMGAIGGEQW
jgi:hypothetical protein